MSRFTCTPCQWPGLGILDHVSGLRMLACLKQEF